MTVHDVLLEYERRLAEAQAGLAQARFHSIYAGLVLGIAAALLLTLGVLAIRNQISLWWPSAPVPIAAVSARIYKRRRQMEAMLGLTRRFFERAVRRVNGEWKGAGESGVQFDDAAHAYAHDVGIFGVGSLFELLCTARSAVGKRGLAEYLLEPPGFDETLARQRAVDELRGRVGLREKIAMLGPFEFADSTYETFDGWLHSPLVSFHAALRAGILVSSSILALLLAAGFVQLIPGVAILRWVAPLLVFHGALGWMLRGRIKPMIDSARSLSVETQVIREGLELLETADFASPKLRHLSKQARGAARSVRRLERLLNALNERTKEWFYFPSLVLMTGTQLAMAIESWRIRNRDALREWLKAWAEFEALNALAGYAYENPDDSFPELLAGDAAFEARALGHPLIPYGRCVRNDIELNGGSRFLLISGSNMSGKSTLLRAMGLNAVLARAGAPVRAESLRLSPFTVCASIGVVDSLESNKSKFMAEIERLRQAIELASQNPPVLFLIDEILSGTNSRDRRVAAEAVIGTLVERGARGALSTHDLAVAEMAEELKGVNVHLGSAEGGGPMDFDYRLKPGVTTESNALAIARMAGVPV